MRDVRSKYGLSWHWAGSEANMERLSNLPSRIGQVAVNPEQFIFPNSNHRPFHSQEEIVQVLSRGIGRVAPDTKVIIGDLTDYFLLHTQMNPRQMFFKPENKGIAIRTRTQVMMIDVAAYHGPSLAVLDYFERGIWIDHGFGEAPDQSLWVAPLIIPSGS
ncbi:hypothetical protein HYZ05_00540 [Candidatus Daviesbacteria bacterium]|nr:hypothetical protein [Candidatus Daviesbacteria bacterium]